MQTLTLDKFISSVPSHWTGLNSTTVINTKLLLTQLAQSHLSGRWLDELRTKQTGTVELYQDPDNEFILLAHSEPKGLYRQPHDHGDGWVFYAVLEGEMEMSTYMKSTEKPSAPTLISRGSYRMKKGDCNVFLPGDIHDTRCLSEQVIMFRLTSCDIGIEKKEGRMTVYR